VASKAAAARAAAVEVEAPGSMAVASAADYRVAVASNYYLGHR